MQSLRRFGSRFERRLGAALLLLALLGPLLLRPMLLAHSVAHADLSVSFAQLHSTAPGPMGLEHERGDALCHWLDHQLAACDAPLLTLPPHTVALPVDAPTPRAALHRVDLAHRGPQARDPPQV